MKKILGIAIVLALAFVMIAGPASAGTYSTTVAFTKPTTYSDTSVIGAEGSTMTTAIYYETGPSSAWNPATATLGGTSAAGGSTVTFNVTAPASYPVTFAGKTTIGTGTSGFSALKQAADTPMLAPNPPVLNTVTYN